LSPSPFKLSLFASFSLSPLFCSPTDASFDLKVVGSMTLPGAGLLSAAIDAIPAQIFFNGALLGAATIPAFPAGSGGRLDFTIQQAFAVTQLATLQSFLTTFIKTPQTAWQIRAQMTVTPTLAGFALQQYAGVTLDQAVALTGVNGPKNVQILDITLTQLLPPKARAQINMVNPSIASMQIAGTAVFALKLKGLMVAEMSAPPFTLQRGNNPLTTAVVVKLAGPGVPHAADVMEEEDMRAEMDAVEAKFGAGAAINLQVTGLKVQNAAAGYLNTAIQAIDITVPFPLALIKRLLPGPFG
jgi:hypothetical protein